MTMDNDFLKAACQNMAKTPKKSANLFSGQVQEPDDEEKSSGGVK
jgi:hypothetical protein